MKNFLEKNTTKNFFEKITTKNFSRKNHDQKFSRKSCDQKFSLELYFSGLLKNDFRIAVGRFPVAQINVIQL